MQSDQVRFACIEGSRHIPIYSPFYHFSSTVNDIRLKNPKCLASIRIKQKCQLVLVYSLSYFSCQKTIDTENIFKKYLQKNVVIMFQFPAKPIDFNFAEIVIGVEKKHSSQKQNSMCARHG